MKASLARLQKTESASSFKSFMENMFEGAKEQMQSYISQFGVELSPEARRLAVEDVRRDVHDMMHPFFKRFVQIARQDAAKSFNAAVADDLEISIKLMDDLKKLKSKAVAEIHKKIRDLTPKYAPDKWKTNYEVNQFERTLDEFIEMREEQAKLQGILPRSRKPIELSIFHFVAHPLGRDHRQDPLGDRDDDVFEYDAEHASYPDMTVRPSVARDIATTSAAKEFAREMLMFPLSVKSPYIPMVAKRSKKANKPPAKVIIFIQHRSWTH